MTIKVKTFGNFLVYLRSVDGEAVLVSSIRHNLEPAISFGGPSEQLLTKYETALQYRGISFIYRSKINEGDPLQEVDQILKIANEANIPVIPVEEGDSVSID